jgi:hypothetical protein
MLVRLDPWLRAEPPASCCTGQRDRLMHQGAAGQGQVRQGAPAAPGVYGIVTLNNERCWRVARTTAAVLTGLLAVQVQEPLDTTQF